MGEATKNEGKKKADVGAAAVNLKGNLNCERCAKEVKRPVKNMDGVEKVTTDCGANKVMVTRKVDAPAIKEEVEEVEQKTKKKVEIVSPQLKKDRGGDKKAEKKPDEKKPAKDKKPKEAAKNEGKKKPAAAVDLNDKKKDRSGDRKPDERKPAKDERKPKESKADLEFKLKGVKSVKVEAAMGVEVKVKAKKEVEVEVKLKGAEVEVKVKRA